MHSFLFKTACLNLKQQNTSEKEKELEHFNARILKENFCSLN
jgi:hypothetical protein